MLDTNFLFQPRGHGTGWCFRMVTPLPLVGRINPRTNRPYGREVREGLRTRDLQQARRLRDLRLGKLRLEELQVLQELHGSMEQALQLASDLRVVDDDEQRDNIRHVIEIEAEKIKERAGVQKSSRWYKAALGMSTPLKEICEQYKSDAGKSLSLSTINNINTVFKEFFDFAGKDVSIEEIDRKRAGEFVVKYLPNKKGPKVPNGQGPATIRKKVSQLNQVWVWARKRGLILRDQENPWEEQAPSAKEVIRCQRCVGIHGKSKYQHHGNSRFQRSQQYPSFPGFSLVVLLQDRRGVPTTRRLKLIRNLRAITL